MHPPTPDAEPVMHPLLTSALNLAVPPESVGKDFVAGLVVSTVHQHDVGWETAVAVEDGQWHPVERYPDRQEAVAGHARWVDRAPGLTAVMDLGLPGYVDPQLVTLDRKAGTG